MSITYDRISSVTLRIFTTFIIIAFFLTNIPIYANEYSLIQDIETINEIKKFCKKIKNLSETSTLEEIGKTVVSFKKFAEKQTKQKISYDALYADCSKTMKREHISGNEQVLKSFLLRLKKYEKNGKFLVEKKSKDEEDPLKNVHPKVILGAVFILTSSLVFAIGAVIIPAQTVCNTIGYTMIAEGIALISDASCEESRNNEKR